MSTTLTFANTTSNTIATEWFSQQFSHTTFSSCASRSVLWRHILKLSNSIIRNSNHLREFQHFSRFQLRSGGEKLFAFGILWKYSHKHQRGRISENFSSSRMVRELCGSEQSTGTCLITEILGSGIGGLRSDLQACNPATCAGICFYKVGKVGRWK